MARTLQFVVLLACLLLVLALPVAGGNNPENERAYRGQLDGIPTEAVRDSVGADEVKRKRPKRISMPDVQPDIYRPEDMIKIDKLPKDKMKPVMVALKPEKQGNQAKSESKDEWNATRPEAIPRRVDARCQWERAKDDTRGKSEIIKWNIWMSPNGNEFPKWCQDLELGIRNTCRNQNGELLQKNHAEDKTDKLRWTRCDSNANDNLLDGPGWTASFSMLDWNKVDLDEKKSDVEMGRRCVENAIRHAATGAIIDWKMWKESPGQTGCYKINQDPLLHVPKGQLAEAKDIKESKKPG